MNYGRLIESALFGTALSMFIWIFATIVLAIDAIYLDIEAIGSIFLFWGNAIILTIVIYFLNFSWSIK